MCELGIEVLTPKVVAREQCLPVLWPERTWRPTVLDLGPCSERSIHSLSAGACNPKWSWNHAAVLLGNIHHFPGIFSCMCLTISLFTFFIYNIFLVFSALNKNSFPWNLGPMPIITRRQSVLAVNFLEVPAPSSPSELHSQGSSQYPAFSHLRVLAHALAHAVRLASEELPHFILLLHRWCFLKKYSLIICSPPPMCPTIHAPHRLHSPTLEVISPFFLLLTHFTVGSEQMETIVLMSIGSGFKFWL